MANTIEYKGYIGSIEYSSEENFYAVIEEYLETCNALGHEPQKIYKCVFNVWIEPELYKRVYQEAVRVGALNSYFRLALNRLFFWGGII